MDVLAPGIGEIIGGSQREERLEFLDRRMAERGIDREHYACYRDLRRYGTVPTPASVSSAPSLASPAPSTCATRSPSREPPATQGIEGYDYGVNPLAKAIWKGWSTAIPDRGGNYILDPT